MSTSDSQDYSRRAEECLRLAGACISESNRQLLLYAAIHWQSLAEQVATADNALFTGQIERGHAPQKAA